MSVAPAGRALSSVPFVVDYDQTLDQLLDAARVGWRAPARLGVFGSGRHALEAVRVAFDVDVSAPEVMDWLTARKLRPATYFELLSAAPAADTTATVVAIGSSDVNFVGGSAAPALATFEGERQVVMTGFLLRWPAGTEFLAVPDALPAGHGTAKHNHLFPLSARRSPKLVFQQLPCEARFAAVPYDGAVPLQQAVKPAKLRSVSEYAYDEARFPPGQPLQTTLDMTVVTWNRQLRSVEARALLAARGLRPATMRELVALVAAAPDVMDERAIWALADASCAGAYKAGARTLGVHQGIDNGSDPALGAARWDFSTWFAGVRTQR